MINYCLTLDNKGHIIKTRGGNYLEKLYTVQEVADYLGLSRKTIYRYLKAGKLKAKKVGAEYRITQSQLDELLNGLPKEG